MVVHSAGCGSANTHPPPPQGHGRAGSHQLSLTFFVLFFQGNHFQFDTLRRAKHSSMMVLYHLHNPSEPAFVANCNICQAEISAGAGWRCTVCPDYDMCDACYRTQKHPHELTRDKTVRVAPQRAGSAPQAQASNWALESMAESRGAPAASRGPKRKAGRNRPMFVPAQYGGTNFGGPQGGPSTL
jgi:hypothetical protein